MKLLLIYNGKTAQSWLQKALEDYTGRLAHYIKTDTIVIPEVKSTKGLSAAVQMEREAEQMLKVLQAGDFVVLLDEHGKEMRSVEMADWLGRQMQQTKRLVFVVGGPYGFSPRMKEKASELISLSKLTFSHQMVRLLLVEQLYRACTILRGEPYHHE